jgi:hypothetical protein
MANSLLPPAPEGSELQRWVSEGQRHEPGHSNVVNFVSPEKEFSMSIEVDDPLHGYLIRLWTNLDDGQDKRIAQTVIDDCDLAIQVAAEMAAAAEDLEAVAERPSLGPEKIYEEDIDRGTVEAPNDDWEDDEWQDALEDAYDEAGLVRSKGTLTTKQIDGREYYYLQWREGEKVKSQYVGPVSPASS